MDALCQRLAEGASVPPAAAAPAAPVAMDQLRKLGDLRDAGVLTPQEFDAKKSELLDRLCDAALDQAWRARCGRTMSRRGR